MKNKLWFIIVTFQPNPKKLLSLLARLKNYPVVLVDNSPKYPNNPKFPSNVRLIKNQQNLGFGPAFNTGAKVALKNGADFVINISPDVELTPAALSFLRQKITNNEAHLSGPFAGWLDQKRYTTILPQIQRETAINFDYLSGELLAIYREVFTKVGFFYEPYFLYYEDTDFCLRAKKCGFILKHLYHRGFRHHPINVLGKNSFLHSYYLSRNHLHFVQRQAPKKVVCYEILRFPKTVWEHLRLKQTGALLGIRDYLLQRFGEIKG